MNKTITIIELRWERLKEGENLLKKIRDSA